MIDRNFVQSPANAHCASPLRTLYFFYCQELAIELVQIFYLMFWWHGFESKVYGPGGHMDPQQKPHVMQLNRQIPWMTALFQSSVSMIFYCQNNCCSPWGWSSVRQSLRPCKPVKTALFCRFPSSMWGKVKPFSLNDKCRCESRHIKV